jgi:hypothetical protein
LAASRALQPQREADIAEPELTARPLAVKVAVVALPMKLRAQMRNG